MIKVKNILFYIVSAYGKEAFDNSVLTNVDMILSKPISLQNVKDIINKHLNFYKHLYLITINILYFSFNLTH
jgi:hypothetical protein